MFAFMEQNAESDRSLRNRKDEGGEEEEHAEEATNEDMNCRLTRSEKRVRRRAEESARREEGPDRPRSSGRS